MARFNTKVLLFLLLMSWIIQGQVKATPGPEFSSLKSLLSIRQQEPKMYLPMQSMIGSEINILVLAPGAKKIRIFGSTEPGETVIDGKVLKIGSNYSEIGSEANPRAEFKVKLDPTQFADLVSKFYYFDSLITYEDGSTRNASFYGPSAAYTNINAVRVIAEPKDNNAAMSIARTVMPNFFNQTPRF